MNTEIYKQFKTNLDILLFCDNMSMADRFHKECRDLIIEMHYNIREQTKEADKLIIDNAEKRLNRVYNLIKNYNENTNI